MNIELTQREEETFHVLMAVVARSAPDTVLRVAGGWVRDKLLGRESSDIDISPDNMTGEAFARRVKAYLDAEGVRAGEVTVVKANPAQSKHLATAMLKVRGVSIDFVQLRSEGYSRASRIPSEVRPGTPEEDASRRDLTVNALFYNINEGRVEDFVGGLPDLENRVARTPIDPYRTFMDDPLRVLRVVRFAATFNLTPEPALIQAARRGEVRRALLEKVSRERIWTELAWKPEGTALKPGALSGPDPVRAARLLFDMGLVETLFSVNPQEMARLGLTAPLEPFDMDQHTPHHTLDLWAHTLEVLRHGIRLAKKNRWDTRERTVIAFGALLHDIGKRSPGVIGTHKQGYRTYHGHEQVSTALSEAILHGLKAPNDLIRQVCRIVEAHGRPRNLAEGASGKAVRRFLRDLGEDWSLTLTLSLADVLAKATEPQEEVEARYHRLESRLLESRELMGGTSPKRPVTGHDLAAIGIPPGPRMGEILGALDELLLENPELTREEAMAFIQIVAR